MIRIYTILPLLVSLSLALVGCTADGVREAPDPSPSPVRPEEQGGEEGKIDYRNVIPGEVVIKLTPEQLSDLGTQSRSLSSLRSISSSEVQQSLREIGAVEMRPLFPDSPKYRKRHHEAGLDRWMIVSFKGDKTSLQARDLLRASETFEYVELQWAMAQPEPKITPLTEEQLRALSAVTPGATGEGFDDPLLRYQWHYRNLGTDVPHQLAGADINLFPAWEMETGKPSVVVCVVDGGIDFTHPDLAAHLDKSRSFNFVYDKEGRYKGQDLYDASGHGTHVAGTITAVNNNGIGVAGVAGGDGRPGTGVTVINAQIFGYPGEQTPPGVVGIAYGADNGAVISQNSWGYLTPGPGKPLPQDMEAIDYFIKYAGTDENGDQLPGSPMKGGVVIFAAGNDNLVYHNYPGAYYKCISVSSFAWDFRRAYYSNSGVWVSIAAPGGDAYHHGTRGQILSTVPTFYDKSGYGFMQGTSMACPHVSGIAALIVSKYGGEGFTADMLRERLMSALRPFDINALNPRYAGGLGAGYIDAAAALMDNDQLPPEAPSELRAEPSYTEVKLSWRSSADRDGLGGAAFAYDVYISEEKLTEESLSSIKPLRVYGKGLHPGVTISRVIKQLKDGTSYYVAVRAVDRFGLTSQPLFGSFTTAVLTVPTVTEGLPKGPVLIPTTDVAELTLKVSDPDGHRWTYRIAGDTEGVMVRRKDDLLALSIRPLSAPGDYTLGLILTNQHGKSQTVEIPYRVIRYESVGLARSLAPYTGALGGDPITLDLGRIFRHTEGTLLTYTATSERSDVATVSLDVARLTIRLRAVGTAPIRVTATDGHTSFTTRLQVRVTRR